MAVRALGLAGLWFAVAALPAAGEAPQESEKQLAVAPECALRTGGPGVERSDHCLSCHARGGPTHGSSHPIGIDYEHARAQRSGGLPLRPAAEVLRGGLRLPEGQVRCITCHDPNSPWKYHLAIPKGAEPSTVDPSDPASYEEGVLLAERLAKLREDAAAGRRPAVGTRALCLACHAAD